MHSNRLPNRAFLIQLKFYEKKRYQMGTKQEMEMMTRAAMISAKAYEVKGA